MLSDLGEISLWRSMCGDLLVSARPLSWGKLRSIPFFSPSRDMGLSSLTMDKLCDLERTYSPAEHLPSSSVIKGVHTFLKGRWGLYVRLCNGPKYSPSQMPTFFNFSWLYSAKVWCRLATL